MSSPKYSGTALVNDADKESINKAILDMLTKINEVGAIADAAATNAQNALLGIVPPVGYVYTQGPDDMAPSSLWPTATWSNVSSEEAGSFRRFEGGSASAFDSGQQLDAFQGHFHAESMFSTNSQAGANRIPSSGPGFVSAPTVDIDNFLIGAPTSDGSSGTPRTASETRPVNYTVRKWRRTA